MSKTKLIELIEAGEIVTVNGNPKFSGNYFFIPEEPQAIIDEACKEQRDACADKYELWQEECNYENILNAPQPKTEIKL